MLTAKQERFARAYVETGNASEAYRRAYPGSEKWTPESLHSKASNMLALDKVSARVAALQAHHAKRHDITVDKIVRELALLGFANMKDYIVTQADGTAYADLSNLTREQAAAIGEITSETYTEGGGENSREVKRTKFKLLDKRAALVDLGKHLGMFPTQLNGKLDIEHGAAPGALPALAAFISAATGAGEETPPPPTIPN